MAASKSYLARQNYRFLDQNHHPHHLHSHHHHDFELDESDVYDRHSHLPDSPEFRKMARTRIASFSVHEGVGRTLKGRDLSRVRNAIWEKTGFQD
ncbi:unnamed protein product [Linum trigynum]|uniref:Senescence regulator S40 n=1 Tax=Linum trigynum TaxID=586398 RepID=A0AAV2E2A1_9ROSI